MTALDEQVGGSHYKDMKRQPIEFILENDLTYPEGCVIKYICRHRSKGGRLDLEKAKQCIDFIIEDEYPKSTIDLSLSEFPESFCTKCNHGFKSGILSGSLTCTCKCHKETKDA